MKILFCGFGRAGKDHGAMHLSRITGLRYGGSFSWAGLPYMAGVLNLHEMEAWERRHEDRARWKKELDHLRTLDQTVLAKAAISTGDIVTGLRDKLELQACRKEGLFDHIVWVERCGTPFDITVTYSAKDCDDVILNNGTLDDYHNALWAFADRYGLAKVNLGGRCV